MTGQYTAKFTGHVEGRSIELRCYIFCAMTCIIDLCRANGADGLQKDPDFSSPILE
jgi:hypothetical protein